MFPEDTLTVLNTLRGFLLKAHQQRLCLVFFFSFGDDNNVPTARTSHSLLQIRRKSEFHLRRERDNTKKKKKKPTWVMGVFRGLSERGVKTKALFQRVRVIANRKRRNKQKVVVVGGRTALRSLTPMAASSGKRGTILQTGKFRRSGHAPWSVVEKIEFVWGQRSRIFPSTDVRLPTRCRRMRPHNKQRFYMTHHLFGLYDSSSLTKSTFYSLHMSRSRRVKASICTH